jgi:hypothetical protein
MAQCWGKSLDRFYLCGAIVTMVEHGVVVADGADRAELVGQHPGAAELFPSRRKNAGRLAWPITTEVRWR